MGVGLSVRSDRPRRAVKSGPKARWWKRWILVPVVLLLCAVVPWLIPWPWQNQLDELTADPASGSTAVRPSPNGSSAAGPDDKSVEDLEKKLADQKEAYDLPVDRSEVKGVSTEPGPYEKLGRIAIPRVGLDVPFGEGVFAETLDRGPGHWPGTPMPGRSGNSVISGHRNTNTQPFKRIDELDPGDDITVTLQDGAKTTFEVDDTTIVPEREYREFVLRQPKADRPRQLTIFACHPEGEPIYRIVIRATAKD